MYIGQAMISKLFILSFAVLLLFPLVCEAQCSCFTVIGVRVDFTAFGIYATRYAYDSQLIEQDGTEFVQVQTMLNAAVQREILFNTIAVYGGATLVYECPDGVVRYYFYQNWSR
jgi:hypothetical protein